ncbi:MAG: peptidyl-prolyl cis-trans isomerase [Candidatus Wenzhouxiangella sp. M2_3B_020]
MIHKILFSLLVCISIVGCQQEPDHPLVESDDVVLVEVEGEPITLDMLEYLMEARGVAEDDTEGMRELLDELIKLRAVANRAGREGISDRPEVRAQRMIDDIQIQYVRFLEFFQAQNPVTDAEIAAVYAEQSERAGDRRYRLETIEFEDQARALKELGELLTGELTFERAIELATADDRVVRRTDWVDGSQVPPDFRGVLQDAEADDIVESLLPYQGRWMIVRVIDTDSFAPPALDEVREGIRRTLLRERTQAMIERTAESADVTPMLPLEDASDDGGGG